MFQKILISEVKNWSGPKKLDKKGVEMTTPGERNNMGD
jgi:hypothetical protein